MDVPKTKSMKLLVTKSKTTTETTIDKKIVMDIDLSQMDEDDKSKLLNALLNEVEPEEIENVLYDNPSALMAIMNNHARIDDQEIKHMVYILEGDVDHVELKKDLRSLIEKYNLQDEL